MQIQIKIICLVFICFFSCGIVALGSDTQTKADNIKQSEDIEAGVGLTEKTGGFIDMNAKFLDSKGQEVILKDYIDRPTLVLMIFFHCSQACGLQMAFLATALKQMNDIPGKDYKVLSISFDDEDTPESAKNMKNGYIKLAQDDFPPENWLFLTGSQKNIKAVTKSLGYQFKKIEKHNFIHPNVLVTVSGNGQITRYLHGPNFQAFDVSMSLAEARKGILGISIKKAFSYCFEYDPLKKRYVFKVFQMIGIVTVIVLILFYWLFLKKGNQGGKRNKY